MIKQIQLFFSIEDEVAFTNSIRLIRPRVSVVDGCRWISSIPPVVPSIAECSSPFAFLWDRAIVERLPFLPRGASEFEGPATSVVLEVTRSRKQGNLLLSGRLAASTGNSGSGVAVAMDQFAADVWMVMKAITVPVVAVDPSKGKIVREKVSTYRAGRHAATWANSNADHSFRDRSVLNLFFKPRP